MKITCRVYFIFIMAVLILMSIVPLVGMAEGVIAAKMTEQDLIEASFEKQKKDGHIDFWTIEERHEFEKPFVEYLLLKADDPYHMPLNGLPEEDDLTQGKAREAAIQAVKQEFGENAFDDGRVWWEKESLYFFVYFGGDRDGDREWRFGFCSRAADSKQAPIHPLRDGSGQAALLGLSSIGYWPNGITAGSGSSTTRLQAAGQDSWARGT